MNKNKKKNNKKNVKIVHDSSLEIKEPVNLICPIAEKMDEKQEENHSNPLVSVLTTLLILSLFGCIFLGNRLYQASLIIIPPVAPIEHYNVVTNNQYVTNTVYITNSPINSLFNGKQYYNIDIPKDASFLLSPIIIQKTNYFKPQKPITNGETLRFDNKLPVDN